MTRTISERITRALAGEWEALLGDSEQSVRYACSANQQKQDLAHIAKRINEAVAAGDRRRANQLVKGPAELASSQVVRQRLPGLFPAPSAPLVEGDTP